MSTAMPTASVAPAFAPLPIEHARAARRAGALGGLLVGIGLPLALSPAFAWGLIGLQRWSTNLSIRRDEVTPQTLEVLDHMLQTLSSPLAIVLAVVCVLVGAGLVAVGIATWVRRLRRAGVHRPVAVALLGLLLARVGTWVVGIVLGGLPELLVGIWLPPMFGIAFDRVLGDDLGVPTVLVFTIAGVLVALAGLVLGGGTWLAAGLLTTWWMARALRERVPVVVATHPWPDAAQQWPGAAQHRPDAAQQWPGAAGQPLADQPAPDRLP